MVRKPLVQPAADEPADREVRLRLPHQAAVVHDAEQEARQHQADGHLRIDPRTPAVGAMAVGDLVVQPAGSGTRSTRARMWSSGTSCPSDPATNSSSWAGGLRSASRGSPRSRNNIMFQEPRNEGFFNSPVPPRFRLCPDIRARRYRRGRGRSRNSARANSRRDGGLGNQDLLQRLGARASDMDPARASPCRPAASIDAPRR